jgi:asparagine synthase (glutamine-hydrolysing)
MGLNLVSAGEGSDESFGGYKDLTHEFLLESDLSWPSSLSGTELTDVAQKSKATYSLQGMPEPGRGLPESTRRMLNNTSILSRLLIIGRLPFAEWTDSFTATRPETAQVERLDGRVREAIINRWHPLHTAEYLWTKGFFCNMLLRYLGDNIDMVHHVETRPPFLDHHLSEYANNIPPSLKIKYSSSDGSFTEKYVLREAVRPFVTDEIYKRTKKPYLGPTKFEENGPLHQLFCRLTSRENVDALGFIDWARTQVLVQKAFQEKDPWAFRVAFSVCQFVVLSQRFGVVRASSL